MLEVSENTSFASRHMVILMLLRVGTVINCMMCLKYDVSKRFHRNRMLVENL